MQLAADPSPHLRWKESPREPGGLWTTAASEATHPPATASSQPAASTQAHCPDNTNLGDWLLSTGLHLGGSAP